MPKQFRAFEPDALLAELRAFPWERRVWRVRRPVPEPEALAEAAALLRGARKPLIVSGGGTIYAEATEALRELAEATGVPVAETQAGKGSLPYDHPQEVGAIAVTLKKLDKAAKALGCRVSYLAGGQKMTLILKKGA